jgi:lipoprotein NlpI
MSIQLCTFVYLAGITKERAETIRRSFYRYLENYAWATPLTWIMDMKTCRELLPKLQQLADQFAKETGGKMLFQYYIISVSINTLRELLQNARPPEKEEVAERLKKILKSKELIELFA